MHLNPIRAMITAGLRMREEGVEESGYHRRSLAETAMFRFKTIFGDHLNARETQRQKSEARIKCSALNRMTRLGMPDSFYQLKLPIEALCPFQYSCNKAFKWQKLSLSDPR
jgi:hypothetical protein